MAFTTVLAVTFKREHDSESESGVLIEPHDGGIVLLDMKGNVIRECWSHEHDAYNGCFRLEVTD